MEALKMMVGRRAGGSHELLAMNRSTQGIIGEFPLCVAMRWLRVDGCNWE